MKSPPIRFRVLDTPWGPMAIVARGGHLVGTLLPERSRRRVRHNISQRWPDAEQDNQLLPRLAGQIAAYAAGRRATLTARCDLSAMTPFQQAVLEACRKIPAGGTLTYGDLARKIGRPRAARAVGQTMARNPIPLVIPCHRVVGVGGRLGGFSASAGTDLKRRLLDHEARHFATRRKP
jgi:methylated-DNA-[protein]-cysteine S-methyltransferase